MPAVQVVTRLVAIAVLCGSTVWADWQIPLMVTDGERVEELVAGVAADATDGYDAKHDFPHAPAPPPPYVLAYFHHADWTAAEPRWYRTDIRKERHLMAAGAKPEVWVAGSKLIVATSQLNANLTVSWNVREVPAEYRVLLRDATAGLTINARQQTSYTFNNGQSSSRGFELRVGGRVASVQVSPANPNVVAGKTQQFTAKAFDALGNDITGFVAFTWAASADCGTIATNGLYTACTKAGQYAGAVRASTEGVTGSTGVTVVPDATAAPPAGRVATATR